MTIVCCGAFFLWMSHRVYLTYAHVVAREERERSKRGESTRSQDHIGPICFLALDLAIIFVLVRGLESLAFDTSQMSELRCFFLSLTHFSFVVALWMLLEGRHLAFFYRKVGQAMGSKQRSAHQPASSLGLFARRNLTAAFFVMVATPLLLEIFGIHMGQASKEAVLLLFGTCFLMPHTVLLAVLIHRLSPLRRRAVARS